MKLEWGKKVSCPACAMHLYDLMKTSVVCPYCGNTFEGNDYKLKKKGTTLDESSKINSDFEFEVEDLETDESVVLDGDEIENDIDVIKKEF